MSQDQSNIIQPFLVSFSENRRRFYLSQVENASLVRRNRTFSSHLFYNFLPSAIASTLLFPLYKLKLLLQINLNRIYESKEVLKLKLLPKINKNW